MQRASPLGHQGRLIGSGERQQVVSDDADLRPLGYRIAEAAA